MSEPVKWRPLLTVGAFAPAIYGLADFLFSWNPLAAAAYDVHRHEPAFRAAPFLGFGGLAEIVNGCLVTAAYALLHDRLSGSPFRKGLWLGALLWGFWVVSGTMTAYVWLALPGAVALANVAAGLPKCLAIGSAVAWIWKRAEGSI